MSKSLRTMSSTQTAVKHENELLDNQTQLMNELFEEIADDLAEVIQGGRAHRCHAQLAAF